MKKIILSSFALAMTLSSFAQGIVFGESPATIRSNYSFSLGEVDQSWGANTFNTQSIIAPAIFVEDGTTGVDMNGDPYSQRGCNALTNAAAVSGKIALIRRGECTFGQKAARAFQAGAVAVIIVNNVPGAIGMNGGTEGLPVTVPVISVGYETGLIFTQALAEGPITLLLGNKIGVFDVDLAVNPTDVQTPRFVTHNTALGALDYPIGLVARNSGSQTVTGAEAKIELVNSSNVVVFTESLTLPSLASGDSVRLLSTSPQHFPNLTGTYPAGEYVLNFIVAVSGDEFPYDDTVKIKMSISDRYLGLAYIGDNEDLIATASFNKPATQVDSREDLFCGMFRHPNASALTVDAIRSAVRINEEVGDLNGRSIAVNLIKWNDDFINNDGDVAFTGLEEVGFGEVIFQRNVQAQEFEATFDEPVTLIDNQRYLVCLMSSDTALWYAFKMTRDVQRNYEIEQESYTIIKTSSWFLLGFGYDTATGVQLRGTTSEVSVSKTEMLAGKAFPNPAQNYVKVQVAKDGDAIVTVTDLSGRTVSTQDVSFLMNQTMIDLSGVNTGMYIINVVYKDGARAKFNVVKG